MPLRQSKADDAQLVVELQAVLASKDAKPGDLAKSITRVGKLLSKRSSVTTPEKVARLTMELAEEAFDIAKTQIEHDVKAYMLWEDWQGLYPHTYLGELEAHPHSQKVS